jgi:hypothetical protein
MSFSFLLEYNTWELILNLSLLKQTLLEELLNACHYPGHAWRSTE